MHTGPTFETNTFWFSPAETFWTVPTSLRTSGLFRGGGGGGISGGRGDVSVYYSGGRGGLDVQDVVNVFGEKITLDRWVLLVLITIVHPHVAVTAIIGVGVPVRRFQMRHLEILLVSTGSLAGTQHLWSRGGRGPVIRLSLLFGTGVISHRFHRGASRGWHTRWCWRRCGWSGDYSRLHTIGVARWWSVVVGRRCGLW